MTDERTEVLIIDDEELVGLTIKGMLTRARIRAIWTPDPDYFLELLVEREPTVIFVDLSMPGTDGVSLLVRISELAPDVPVALISGKGRKVLDAARKSAEEHGLWVKAVLEKPFHAKDVVSVLQDCTEHGCCKGNRSSASRTTHADEPKWILSAEQVAAAIEREQIVPYLQPKISCRDRSLLGFEVLARWPVSEQDAVMPNEFIPLVERAGLMTEMTLSLARQTFSWMKSSGFGELNVALNLSAVSLTDEEFLRQIDALVDEFGLKCDQVTLELTESSADNMSIGTLDCLTRFSLRGYRLSMDDFGTGYSSIAALTRMPFDELKIDREFVDTIQTSDSSRVVVDTVITLGKRLNLTLVAEGVENEETFVALQERGCDEVQGFLFGRPVAPRQFAEIWRDSMPPKSRPRTDL